MGLAASGSLKANEPFQWLGHVHGEPTYLPDSDDPPPPDSRFWFSYSRGISDEGIIVGDIDILSAPASFEEVAFRWKDGAYTQLPFERAYYISPDGRTILGENDLKNDQGGFISTEIVKWALNEDDQVEVTPSVDGPVIQLNDDISAFQKANGQWQEATAFTNFRVRNVSADQSTFVGVKYPGLPGNFRRQAAVWTAEGETLIPLLPGTDVEMEALAVSGDGSIVVGFAYFPFGEIDGDERFGAFMWTESGGVRELRDIAKEVYNGWDDFWDLDEATAITPDGRFVTGIGCRDGEFIEPWVLELASVGIDIVLSQERFEVDDDFGAEITVTSTFPDPVTITLDNPLLMQTKEKHIEIPELEDIQPFVLSRGESRSFSVPLRVLKAGNVELLATGIARKADGEEVQIEDIELVEVTPIEATITITNEEHLLNQTAESKWSPFAQQLNAARREAKLDPYRNLIEIKLEIKNVGDDAIEGVNVPGALDILGLIKSTDPDSLGVPLNPILLIDPDERIIDLTEPDPNITVPEVDLPSEASTTLTWILDAFDGNTDPESDDSANLEFEPLILASLEGKNIRRLATAEFTVIDQLLLEWGIEPTEGRTNYLSGQVVRVKGFLENVSGQDNREGRNILAMVYPIQEGNLGGGFARKKAAPDDKDFPQYYEIFELAYEEPDNKIEWESFFISMPAAASTTGKAKYGVRAWIVEDDGSLTEADSQTKVADDWKDFFDVNLAPNRPLLSSAEERRQECAQLGIWPFLCGVEEGTLELSQGIYGLGQFLFATAEGNLNLYRGIIAYEMLAARSMWEAIKGNPDALDELWKETYAKYVELVEFGVMVGEAGSQVPMVFEAFSIQMGNSMSNFFGAVENGDLAEVQFQAGKFLGANPDLLLEPLAIGMGYARMARALQADVASDFLAAARQQKLARQRSSVSQRIADGKANPAVTDLSSVLLAGDRLSRKNLLDIYGIDADQLKKLQKIARDNGVVLTFRSRNPIARDLIKDGIAWPKPQNLKFKTVNRIDIDYLGYSDEAEAMVDIVSPPGSLINKTGPELETALDQYMDVLKGKKPELAGNDVLAGEVRSRLKTRTEEWNELVPDLQLKPDGNSAVEIETAFEANLQFTGKQKDTIQDIGAKQKRSVNSELVESVTDPVTGQPRKRWKIRMSQPGGGNLRRVSGDVDFMSIMEPNGAMILDADKRLKVYKQLAEAIDMQHGESFTFFIDKARSKYLDGNALGSQRPEALIAISPFGDQTPTAAFFVNSLSIMNGKNSKFLPVREAIKKQDRLVLKEGKIVLEEGKTITMRRPDVSGEYVVLAGAEINSRINLNFVNRFKVDILKATLRTWRDRFFFRFPRMIVRTIGFTTDEAEFVRSGTSNSGESSDSGLPQKQNDSEDAPLLQLELNEEGLLGLKVWTEAEGWSSLNEAEAIELGEPGVLDMLPMTALTEDIERGQKVLPIIPQDEMEITGGFFEVGDRVVINPGGENEEYGTISALGSIVLATGVIYEHRSGELIATLGPDTTDRDGDGLLGWEEIEAGTNPDSADTDFDGIDDAAEVLAGTDPAMNETLKLESITSVADGGIVSFDWSSEPGLHYVLQTSEELNPNTWVDLSSITASTDLSQINLYNVFQDAPRSFYRLSIRGDNDIDTDDLTAREELGLGTENNIADTDEDGFSDGDEVKLGTDPLDPESKLEILAVELDETYGHYEVQFSSSNGVTYAIESSSPQQPGVWTEETQITAETSVTAVLVAADLPEESNLEFRILPLLY